MRPRSGLNRPATMLTIEVLPEPDGPNSAITPSGVSNLAETVKSPSCLSTSTTSMSAPVQPVTGARGEPFGRNKRDQRDDDRDRHEPRGRGITAGDLQIRVDCSRKSLRLARNIRHECDGGAELAERFGKAQHHAGNDAGERERQRHGKKD